MTPDNAPKKILVTGSNGQLGMELQTQTFIYPDFEFVFLDKLEFDITLESRVAERIVAEAPAVVINCGAYTNVEKAEDDRDAAFLVNAKAPGFLAKACQDSNSILVHLSTDYVFDGTKGSPYTEEDVVNPISAYGESKAEGERVIDELLRRHLIIRTSWLYSTYGHNFYKTMSRLALEKGELHVVQDQIASPTYARYLAHDILQWLEAIILNQQHVDYGIYHYSQEGAASWFDFAREIVINKQLNVPVYPVRTEDFPTRARRPRYSKLDNTKFRKASGIDPATWKEGLSSCIFNEQAEL